MTKQQGYSPWKVRDGNKRVLIADDLPLFRTMLRDMLSKRGFEVVGEACNGEEAFHMALELEPDILILDVVMPMIGGLEVARRVLSMNPCLKIIMCTSLRHESLKEEALRAGASALIRKPVDPEELVGAIGDLL